MPTSITLSKLTSMANNDTDETFATTVTVDYFNSAISEINATLHSILPTIDVAVPAYSTTVYTALDDKWLITVVLPYIDYRIKMNDASLSEADRYKAIYQSGLIVLKRNKKVAIAEDYRDEGFLNAYRIYPFSRW